MLTTRLIAPCCQRTTSFERCRPVSRKPSPAKTAPSGPASSSETANSIHSTASGTARGGMRPGRIRSSSQISDRSPSSAIRRGEAMRKRSLKISWLSQPS